MGVHTTENAAAPKVYVLLATAMGHVSIASTAYYLPFLEPIAEAASARFANHCRDVLAVLPGGGGDR